MQGYNGNQGNNAWGGGYTDFSGMNGNRRNNYGYPSQTDQFGRPVQAVEPREYVTGRAGADAYQMPPGVFEKVLWDNSSNRIFIKGYDDHGLPRVIHDYDYQDHVEPEPVQYATKDDIRQMISEAISGLNVAQPNMSGYATMEDLNKALSDLAVGNGGRIVRMNDAVQ